MSPLAGATDRRPRGTDFDRSVRRDSSWLFAGYASTALIGFVYWIVAAVVLPKEALGAEAALVSVFTAAAALTSSGLGSAMVVLLPTAGRWQRLLLTRTAVGIAVLGVAGGLLAGLLAVSVLHLPGPPWLVVTQIIVLTVAWAAFNVEDQVLTGLGQPRWTLFINGPANLSKLGLTVMFTVFIPLEHPIVWATALPAVIGVTFAVTYLIPHYSGPRASALDAPESGPLLRCLRGFVLRDTAAIGVQLAFTFLAPFLVTALAGPGEGAEFALCYQVGAAIDLVATGVAIAMTKNSATNTNLGSKLALGVWLRMLPPLVGVGMLASAATPILLYLVGRGYDPGTGATIVAILSVSSVGRSAYAIWSATMRAKLRLNLVLAVNLTTAVIAAALVALASPAGALAASLALLTSASVPTVVGVFGLFGWWPGPKAAAKGLREVAP